MTLSDPIPANLKVTGITTAATGFPHWQNCAVTGTDADGFGGTLDCDLSAALGVSASAPVITLAVTVRSSTPSGTITNTATTCWDNPSDPVRGAEVRRRLGAGDGHRDPADDRCRTPVWPRPRWAGLPCSCCWVADCS